KTRRGVHRGPPRGSAGYADPGSGGKRTLHRARVCKSGCKAQPPASNRSGPTRLFLHSPLFSPRVNTDEVPSLKFHFTVQREIVRHRAFEALLEAGPLPVHCHRAAAVAAWDGTPATRFDPGPARASISPSPWSLAPVPRHRL